MSFPGFWQPICNQCIHARYRKRTLPRERTGKIPNFLTTESIHEKKKSSDVDQELKQCFSISYCLNIHLHWLLSNERHKSQRLMLPFDKNLSKKTFYGDLATSNDWTVFFELQELKAFSIKCFPQEICQTTGIRTYCEFSQVLLPICSQHNTQYRKGMLPCECTGKLPSFLATESIHFQQKKQHNVNIEFNQCQAIV